MRNEVFVQAPAPWLKKRVDCASPASTHKPFIYLKPTRLLTRFTAT